MSDTIWDPGDNVQHRVSESCQEIRNIRTVEHRFESRQQDDVNTGSPRRRNISCTKEGHNPHQDGAGRKDELRGDGQENGYHIGDWNEDFEKARRHNVEIDRGQYSHDDP